MGNYLVSREGYPDEWHLLMVYYEAFAVIDEGLSYLNPKHFSVVQLCKIMKNGM